VLETERLLLRKIKPEDAKDMYEYAARPDTSKYLIWEKHPHYSYTVELIRFLQREYAQGRFFDFAVVLKEESKMIGTVGFTSYDENHRVAEVGYVINPAYHGRGIAPEALSAIINFAFCELDVNRVEARYIAENAPSLRVMEKCGMTHEGIQRQKMIIKGVARDIGVCSILKSEYFCCERENIYRKREEKGLIARLFHKN
jgi:ribosomal-protein-alanine N-acetyltransferase